MSVSNQAAQDDAGTPYGCHNHPPFKDGYYARGGTRLIPDPESDDPTQMIGVPIMIWISTKDITKKCMNDKNTTERRCRRCKHIGGEATTQMAA